MNISEIRQKLGDATEQIEQKLTPYYTSLEPWQRGLLLITLVLFLFFSVYYLTKPNKNSTEKIQSKQESLVEEKLMRQMAFFKKLRD